MLTATPHIFKMFEYLAYDVQQETGIQVHYEHGSRRNIDNILMAWNKTPGTSSGKYPMIALIQPFEERRGTAPDLMAEISVTVVIATLTDPNWTPDQRECYSFLPILRPLRDQFMESIRKSGYFRFANLANVEHTSTDLYHWGEAGSNVFSDYVDSILISNLSLKVKQFNCK